MKTLFQRMINILFYISIAALLAVGAIGVTVEVAGPVVFDRICSYLGLINGFDHFWNLSMIILICFAGLYFAMRFMRKT